MAKKLSKKVAVKAAASSTARARAPGKPKYKRNARAAPSDESSSSSSSSVLDSEDELRLDRAAAKDDDDSDDGEASSEGDESGLLNVGFEFCDLKEIHFRSIKQFLTSFGQPIHAELDSSGLADLLISHGRASTVIEIDDNNEHDAFALMSLLSFDDHKVQPRHAPNKTHVSLL